MDKYLKENTNNNIILYNTLDDNEKFAAGIETIYQNYIRLYEFGLTMSGFQFIGLTMEASSLTTNIMKVSYFFLALCFLFSLFGSTISYLIVKYIDGIRYEDKEFILAGLHKYRRLLKFNEVLPYMNSGLFLISLNTLIHQELDIYYAIIFNCLSFLLFTTGLSLMGVLILKNQQYGSIKRFKSMV